MPGREIPLVTGEYYHIYNRGVAKGPTFTDVFEYERALNLLNYYRFTDANARFSFFKELDEEVKQTIIEELKHKYSIMVSILVFVLMPNHFHLLLKQEIDGGISNFMSKFTNSYTRYFNVKNKRVGPLFQGKFKSKHINTTEQFIHLSRYQHLNPLTDGVVKSFSDLVVYPNSSLVDYLGSDSRDFISTKPILSHFKGKGYYKRFVQSNIEYQRQLSQIKHLLIDSP